MLKALNDELEKLGLNYEFGEMTKTPIAYPYWVGDYTEPESMTEDGLEQPTVMLTGFNRGSWAALEEQKKLLKDHFKHGVTVITDAGDAVVFFYADSLNVPLDEGELKKCQVNLAVKIWRGR